MPSSTTLNKFYYVYVLISLSDNKKYIGYTNDLRKRIKEHNEGKCFSTSHRRPLELIYYEACLSKADAQRREKYLKTTGGRKFLAKRLQIYFKNQ